MEKIYEAPNKLSVYVGNDIDYERIKDNHNFKTARMCKFGPDGHKDTLGYNSMGAPKDKNYISVIKKNRISVNIIDVDDPNFIPFECIKDALEYIVQQLKDGFNVLIACNAGESRAPSTGMAFLRAIGELPFNFHTSESIYNGIYSKYNPGLGVRQVLRQNWSLLDGMLLEKENG